MIKEAGPSFQVLYQDHHASEDPNMENMGSTGDVPGFEGLDDDIAIENEVTCTHLKIRGHVSDELDREVVKETIDIQNNSNFKE